MYKVIRFFLDCYFRLSYSYEYTFKTDASIFKGPLLIAANHQTNWDPFLIHAVIPVRLAFMAKEELFKIPVLGWVMKREGAIPVKRGGSGDRISLADRSGHRLRHAFHRRQTSFHPAPRHTGRDCGDLGSVDQGARTERLTELDRTPRAGQTPHPAGHRRARGNQA